MNEQEEARILAEEWMGWTYRAFKKPDLTAKSKGYYVKDGKHICSDLDWHPRTDITQAMMVLRSFPSYELFKTDRGEIGCNIYERYSLEIIFGGYHTTEEAAICAAAMKTRD